MTEAEKQPTKKYRGNCHCGNYVFEFEMPEIKSASDCNCSICFKKGYKWIFPGDSMTIIKGEDALVEYTFAAGNTKHRFCSTCGSPVCAYNSTFPPGMNAAINARCIQDLDVSKLENSVYDGLKLDPVYTTPKFTGKDPSVEVDGGKVYHGSCHCGGVKLAVKVPVLDGTYSNLITECNCSICQRNASIWIYAKADQIAIEGEDNLTYYAMGFKVWQKGFCKICGVQLVSRWVPLTNEELAALPETHRKRRNPVGPQEMVAVTLRVLNDFDMTAIKKEQIKMANGWELWEPKYENP